MIPQAKMVWAGLEFRMPLLRRNVEPLSEAQMRWIPAPGRVSVAWQLWHIAEVEDNWIRLMVLDEPLHFPFGVQLREAADEQYPTKEQLLAYIAEIRGITRTRLESMTDADFDREVVDVDYGTQTVRDIWAGVVTSLAWHAGQIAMTAKLIPQTPVTTRKFDYWKPKK